MTTAPPVTAAKHEGVLVLELTAPPTNTYYFKYDAAL